MIKKQGVTLVTVSVAVIILLILATTITISVISTMEFSTLSTWANEIIYIQEVVDEYRQTTSALPYTQETISIDLTDVLSDNINEQFEGETISNNIIELNVLSLGNLKITNTIYGNLKTPNDVYAYSKTTGKVYYVQGVAVDDTTYYGLTEGLKQRFSIASVENNLSTVIFVPNNIEYTIDPVVVNVKLPTTVTNITITTSDDNINIGNQEIKDNMYNYIVNTNNIKSNYNITVSYTLAGKVNTATYVVANYDDKKPVISNITEEQFVTINKMPYVTNIAATDESGIQTLKYSYGKIDEQNAKTHFATNGKSLIEGKINLTGDNKEYTIYAEDKAGNYSIYTFEKMYWTYAIYSATDTSLRFVLEDIRINKGDTYNDREVTEVYKNFEQTVYNLTSDVPWYNYRNNITSVITETTVSPKDTSHWFRDFSKCGYFDLTNLDTSKVMDMKYMFRNSGNDASVTEYRIIGTDNWDTSNVTSMYSLFRECGQTATTWDIGNLSSWNTDKVTTFGNMFASAALAAKKIDIGNLDNWDTSQVTNMGGMFFSTAKQATVFDIGKLTNWNTSKVTNMYQMFGASCAKSALEINLGDLNTKEVIRADGTTYIAWDMSNVEDIGEMFSNFGESATSWDIGRLDNWNTSKVNNMSYLFAFAGWADKTWSVGDLSNWDVGKVESMTATFRAAGENSETFNLGNLDNWNVANVKDMRAMFQQAGKNSTSWNIGDLSGWKTSNVTSMKEMFHSTASGLQSNATFSIGDISSWDTSKVTDMTRMFAVTAWQVKWNLDLSGWDVGLVTEYTDFNHSIASKVIAPKFKETTT